MVPVTNSMSANTIDFDVGQALVTQHLPDCPGLYSQDLRYQESVDGVRFIFIN